MSNENRDANGRYAPGPHYEAKFGKSSGRGESKASHSDDRSTDEYRDSIVGKVAEMGHGLEKANEYASYHTSGAAKTVSDLTHSEAQHVEREVKNALVKRQAKLRHLGRRDSER